MTDKVRFAFLFAGLAAAVLGMGAMGNGRRVPLRESFSRMPNYLSGWVGQQFPDLPPDEQKVLRAGDYLLRNYQRAGITLSLFIAYYRTQRSGDAMHSPRNRLPSSGWEPVASRVIRIPFAGSRGGSFKANNYIVAKDDDKVEVIYWYQSAGRKFVSEYLGKIYLVWDRITKNRTGGAIIRITGPAGDARAHQAIVEFGRDLSGALPNSCRIENEEREAGRGTTMRSPI